MFTQTITECWFSLVVVVVVVVVRLMIILLFRLLITNTNTETNHTNTDLHADDRGAPVPILNHIKIPYEHILKYLDLSLPY